MDSFGVRIAITVAFAAVGVFCLVRCVDLGRRARGGDRVAYAVHVLMCLSMVAMVWMPERVLTPQVAAVQMTVFAVAAGCFAVRALGIPASALHLGAAGLGSAGLDAAGLGSAGLDAAGLGSAGQPAQRRGGPECRALRMRCLHHALSMAAMVWMFDVMARGVRLPSGSGMAAMAGGMGASAGRVGLAAAAYCLVSAYVLAVAAARVPRRLRTSATGHGDRRDDLAHAVMSAAMGAALLALV